MNKKKAKTTSQKLEEKIKKIESDVEHFVKENNRLHTKLAREIENTIKEKRLKERAEKDRDDWKFVAMSSSNLMMKLSKGKYPGPMIFNP